MPDVPPRPQTSRRRERYRVFISHGTQDEWVANQIGLRIKQACGAEYFLDAKDIAKGDEIEAVIFRELPRCDELVALLTPWSVHRNWVWVDIGAARALDKRIVAVLYGLTLQELEQVRGGKACLGPTNIAQLNEFDKYLEELQSRVGAQ